MVWIFKPLVLQEKMLKLLNWNQRSIVGSGRGWLYKAIRPVPADRWNNENRRCDSVPSGVCKCFRQELNCPTAGADGQAPVSPVSAAKQAWWGRNNIIKQKKECQEVTASVRGERVCCIWLSLPKQPRIIGGFHRTNDPNPFPPQIWCITMVSTIAGLSGLCLPLDSRAGPTSAHFAPGLPTASAPASALLRAQQQQPKRGCCLSAVDTDSNFEMEEWR